MTRTTISLDVGHGINFDLLIFPNRDLFHKYNSRMGLEYEEGREAWTEWKKHKTEGTYHVQIVFHQEFLNAEVIAHESVHAALIFMRENPDELFPMSINDLDQEEYLATLVGMISQEIAEVHYQITT